MKNRLKFLIKKIVYYIPFIKKLFSKLKFQQTFVGWGMSTSHYPPWDSSSFPNRECREFSAINRKILLDIKTHKMNLLQFVEYNTLEIFEELMWRHFIVFFSVRQALVQTAAIRTEIVLAECGVCDGLTLRFALETLAGLDNNYKAFAYDAWAGMRSDLLLDNEKKCVGNYCHISMENAQNNLNSFSDKVVFIKGYIPESFSQNNNPDSLIWLHIDLNSAKATIESLLFFYDRVLQGGIILFDDYGWFGYRETKKVIDEFLEEKGGSLLPLPTGQAIYFK